VRTLDIELVARRRVEELGAHGLDGSNGGDLGHLHAQHEQACPAHEGRRRHCNGVNNGSGKEDKETIVVVNKASVFYLTNKD
jgi:hypothetical protein